MRTKKPGEFFFIPKLLFPDIKTMSFDAHTKHIGKKREEKSLQIS